MGKSDMGFIAVLLGVIANPVVFAVLAIIFVVLFAVAYATLLVYGLVSALIYSAVGFLVLFLAGKTLLENHWQLVFVVPFLFVFGWISDRMGSWGLSIMPAMISQNYVLSQNAWSDGANVTIYGPLIVALVALVVSMLAFALVKSRRKRRR